ncbi:hypothetical protein AFIC_002090 [[Pseudomonas] carboxydohydrogena]|uniref:Uncharacterized protein n=1 Tax=Afipia carboxydohydrogena TaxID=290 RepID=A0ABY8BM45_AFICR|nr:hypothetical protein [[Pseudomonas] carboxydohydrogena]WEF50546.1 hypothetical protein AFIC_002090 [[Pseudomonas] carboxydohydrogena]
MTSTMTARGHAMVSKSTALSKEELERFEERARAARKADDGLVKEFLSKFAKDYRANIEERKKGTSK